MSKSNNNYRTSPVMYIDKKLVCSSAWISLGGIAPQIYLLFRLRCQVEPIQVNGKPNKRSGHVIKNNGNIVFTYQEALKKYGITKPRFTRALDELLRAGFIDITESGLGYRRLTTKYAVSDRWKDYGTEIFEEKEREKASWNPGFKKKSSNENVTDTSNENVTEPRYLVLRTGRKNKVHKTEYKFRGNKWLQKNIG